jgi:hypothetical protein
MHLEHATPAWLGNFSLDSARCFSMGSTVGPPTPPTTTIIFLCASISTADIEWLWKGPWTRAST